MASLKKRPKCSDCFKLNGNGRPGSRSLPKLGCPKHPEKAELGFSFYLQYYVGGKQWRRNLHTDLDHIAKEQKRRVESAQFSGEVIPLPTRTPIAKIVTDYIRHIRTVKTPKSVQTDIYYMRDLFGPICDELKITSRKVSFATKKRPPKDGQDRRFRAQVIEAAYFEKITTAAISTFIRSRIEERGLAPKTANRYREIMMRMFNWSMNEERIRMPGSVNPVRKVDRREVKAPRITFLRLHQIHEQLTALKMQAQLQAMVATFIFAGLRREELLWLTHDDIDWTFGPHGLILVQAKKVGEEVWQPKTSENRGVPISSMLQPYLEEQRVRAINSVWLFPNSVGSRFDPDNFSSDLRDANRKAKLEWGCLDYRHTFGSQLAMKGESLYKISTLMGNSPQICRRHYAFLMKESLIKSVEFPTSKFNLDNNSTVTMTA